MKYSIPELPINAIPLWPPVILVTFHSLFDYRNTNAGWKRKSSSCYIFSPDFESNYIRKVNELTSGCGGSWDSHTNRHSILGREQRHDTCYTGAFIDQHPPPSPPHTPQALVPTPMLCSFPYLLFFPWTLPPPHVLSVTHCLQFPLFFASSLPDSPPPPFFLLSPNTITILPSILTFPLSRTGLWIKVGVVN